MMQAANSGNVAKVTDLLRDSNMVINFKIRYGNTAFMSTTRNGHDL